MIRFSANLGLLFTEAPILERFQRAADAGFRVVEVWSPLDTGLAEAIERAGVELLQFNLEMGDLQAGDRGFLCLPDQIERFRAGFELAIQYARQLGVRQLNCLAGNRIEGYSLEAQMACMKDNLEWLHPQLEANDLTLTLEPVSRFHSPHFILSRASEWFAFVDELGLERIRVLYDLFHAQLEEGNLTATMRENLSLIGHIHVADAPDRHQPGTGEIDYDFVFAELESMGYEGYVGLEYIPLGSTEESLSWLPAQSRVQTFASELRFR
jgi:hydroxypyruvate isomerase